MNRKEHKQDAEQYPGAGDDENGRPYHPGTFARVSGPHSSYIRQGIGDPTGVTGQVIQPWNPTYRIPAILHAVQTDERLLGHGTR